MKIHFYAWAFAALTVFGWSSKAEAAMLSGSVLTTGLPSPANLTTDGLLDWAFWNAPNNNTTTSMDHHNRMAGGLYAISPITPVGTGTVVRNGNSSSQLFEYTNGISPTTFGPSAVGLVFNNSLQLVGEGLQVDITGDPGQAYVVNVWAAGYNGQGTLTASLNGADPVALLSQNYGTGSPKSPTLFSFTFQPDSASDLLNLSYVLTTIGTGGSNAHVGFQAVTISPVPEPGTWLLAATAGVGFLGWRRWRKGQSTKAE